MTQIILDQSRDVSGRETVRLTSLYPPPDFVKAASHERLMGDPEKTAAHLWADRAEKIYPYHTSAATWMSMLHFLDKKAHFTPEKQAAIEASLNTAAAFFSIEGEIQQLREKVAANAGNEEAQLPDEAFAIVWQYENGHKERHWPMRNAQEVKFAAHTLATNRDTFEFHDRHTIANRILEKSMDFGASLGGHDDAIEKMAGRGACAARQVAEAVEKRASLVRSRFPDESAEMLKFAALVRENPDQARGSEQLVKIAGMLDQFDRATNLLALYDAGGLERPEETLFMVTEKVASEFQSSHVSTVTGKVYDLGQLEKVGIDHYREWLGDDFADAVSTAGVLPDRAKIAAVLPTMDRGMAGMFDRMAAELKIEPVMREKAAAAGGILSGDALYQYALQYAQ